MRTVAPARRGSAVPRRPCLRGRHAGSGRGLRAAAPGPGPGAAERAEDGEGAPAPSCRDQADEPYVLVSQSKGELAAEIEALAAENARLRAQLSEEARTALDAATSAAENAAARALAEQEAKEKAVMGAIKTLDPELSEQLEAVTIPEYKAKRDLSLLDAHVPEPEAGAPPPTELFNICFVASEVAPYSKTGGLGDVAGSLPQALAARGHRVMVVAPRYLNGTSNDEKYAGALDTGLSISVGCYEALQTVHLFHEYREGVDYVFVDHDSFRREGGLYGNQFGEYGDNHFRFTLLSHVACEVPLQLALGGYPYGQSTVFVANDWHAGLVPLLIASKYRPHGVYKDARTILAIHNLKHQGVEQTYMFPNLGVPNEWYGALEFVWPEHMRAHALDKGETVNTLKAAVVTADRVVTVSEGYAHEILTPEGGSHIDGTLLARQSKLNGIVNGIDLEEWNPAADKFTAAPYSVKDLSGKAECKAALQRELGLPERPDVPLIGFIGRLDWQKGPDIIAEAIHELMAEDCQLVMLGSGDADKEQFMQWAEAEGYPDKFRGWVGFSVPVAHRITAGSDILLMPSRFEPCGLNQLYAMRYGTVPVVHETGGLKDTVAPFDPYGHQNFGTGWLFYPLGKDPMMYALREAMGVYRHNQAMWKTMMTTGMTQDFSWERSAVKYEQVFSWARIDPPWCG